MFEYGVSILDSPSDCPHDIFRTGGLSALMEIYYWKKLNMYRSNLMFRNKRLNYNFCRFESHCFLSVVFSGHLQEAHVVFSGPDHTHTAWNGVFLFSGTILRSMLPPNYWCNVFSSGTMISQVSRLAFISSSLRHIHRLYNYGIG